MKTRHLIAEKMVDYETTDFSKRDCETDLHILTCDICLTTQKGVQNLLKKHMNDPNKVKLILEGKLQEKPKSWRPQLLSEINNYKIKLLRSLEPMPQRKWTFAIATPLVIFLLFVLTNVFINPSFNGQLLAEDKNTLLMVKEFYNDDENLSILEKQLLASIDFKTYKIIERMDLSPDNTSYRPRILINGEEHEFLSENEHGALPRGNGGSPKNSNPKYTILKNTQIKTFFELGRIAFWKSDFEEAKDYMNLVFAAPCEIEELKLLKTKSAFYLVKLNNKGKHKKDMPEYLNYLKKNEALVSLTKREGKALKKKYKTYLK